MATVDDLIEQYPYHVRHLGKGEPFYKLWKSAWHAAHELFGEEDGFPVLRIEIPEKGLKHIIVRPEYVQAYKDIRSVYINTMKNSSVKPFKTTDDPKTFTLENVLQGLDTPDEYRPDVHRGSALILMGQPGIGKTIFLWYVLVRRLAIQEVVVYQDLPDRFTIFHEGGVTSVVTTTAITPQQVGNVLPLSTWCLVDSNTSLSNPTPFIIALRHFLVQTASPKALRRNWCEKAGLACYHYIMKPISLRELQLCWGCLREQTTSLESVENFYNLYGPSTWGSLFHSDATWRDKLELAFNVLGSSVFLPAEITENFAYFIDHHPEDSSKILLLKPGENRNEPLVGVITEHVNKLLLEWRDTKWKSRVGDFYATLEEGPLARRTLLHHMIELK